MITRKAYLYFPKSETEKPIVYHLIKDFDLMVNIFRGQVTPEEEGFLSVDITGEESQIEAAFAYLRTFNVVIHAGEVGVVWNADCCTHCGNCTAHCPTDALAFVDDAVRQMAFNEKKCIECLACLTHCPFGACASHF